MTPWYAQIRICQFKRLFKAKTGAMKPDRVSIGSEVAWKHATHTSI